MASSSAFRSDLDATTHIDPDGATTSAMPPGVPPEDVPEARPLPDIFNLEWQRQGVPDTEFYRKYPPDPWGEEAAPNARVWKIYRDHQNIADRDMLDSWNKTLDVLLIFAGLFSAVSTAFLIESYKALQPDYTQYVAAFLYAAAVSHNRTGAVFPTLDAIVAPDSFIQASDTQRWTNGLWFSSLIISLAVALFCILIKQWLDAYEAHNSSATASPKYWAERHCMYNRGLERWGVPGLISFLPLLLHLSLFLFFVGLILFLRPLDGALSNSLLVMVSCIGAFYVLALVLPAWRIECPSYTPLLGQALLAASRAMSGMVYALTRFNWSIADWTPDVLYNWLDRVIQRLRLIQLCTEQHLQREAVTISKCDLDLDGHVLSALIKLPFDSNSGIVHSTCAAIGAVTSVRTTEIIRRAVPSGIVDSQLSHSYHYSGCGEHINTAWTGFDITSHAQLRRAYVAMFPLDGSWWHLHDHPVYAPGLRSSLGIDGLLLQAMGVKDADGTQFDIDFLFRSLQYLPAAEDHPAGSPLRSICLLFLEHYPRGSVDSSLFLPCFLLVFCAGRFSSADVQELVCALRRVEKVFRWRSVSMPAHHGGEMDSARATVNAMWLMLADPERYHIDPLMAQVVTYQACECYRELFPWGTAPWMHLSGLSAFCRSPNFAQCVGSRDRLAKYTRLFLYPTFSECSKDQVGDYWACIATLLRLGWDNLLLSKDAADLWTARDLFPVDPGRWAYYLDRISERGPYSTVDDWYEPVLSAFLDGPNAIATWTDTSSTDHADELVDELTSLARNIAIVLCRRRHLGRANDVFICGFFSGTFLLARFQDILSRDPISSPAWKQESFEKIVLELTKHCLKLSPAGCLEICTQLEEMGDTDSAPRARAIAFVQKLRDGVTPGSALSAACSPDCPCMIERPPAHSWRGVWNNTVSRFRRGPTDSAAATHV